MKKRKKLIDIILSQSEVIAKMQQEINELKARSIDDQLNNSELFLENTKNIGSLIVKLLECALAVEVNYKSLCNLKEGMLELHDAVLSEQSDDIVEKKKSAKTDLN